MDRRRPLIEKGRGKPATTVNPLIVGDLEPESFSLEGSQKVIMKQCVLRLFAVQKGGGLKRSTQHFISDARDEVDGDGAKHVGGAETADDGGGADGRRRRRRHGN
jgi:hypothetical protein